MGCSRVKRPLISRCLRARRASSVQLQVAEAAHKATTTICQAEVAARVGSTVRKVMLVAAAIIALCAACTSPNLTTASSTTAPSTYQLIEAQSPACAAQGQTVARYLDTGQPTSLDPTYGNQRQDVLALTGEQRALKIRQEADQVIQGCDKGTETGGGTYHANKILTTQPYEAVRAVYETIGQDQPDQACGRFDTATQDTFARDVGYPDCRQAVLGLHSQVTNVNDYAESIFPEQYDPNATTIAIDSCDFTISGGPALGVFTVTKVEKGQWLITAHATGPRTCSR